MVYHLQSSVDMESWRRIIAGANALVVSAALPLISVYLAKSPLFPIPRQWQILRMPIESAVPASTSSDGTRENIDQPKSADAASYFSLRATASTATTLTASQAPATTVASLATSTAAATSKEVGGNASMALLAPCGCPESGSLFSSNSGSQNQPLSSTIEAEF